MEWTSITSWPNMARKSIGPLGTSIGTPLMNTVIVAGIRRQSEPINPHTVSSESTLKKKSNIAAS